MQRNAVKFFARTAPQPKDLFHFKVQSYRPGTVYLASGQRAL